MAIRHAQRLVHLGDADAAATEGREDADSPVAFLPLPRRTDPFDESRIIHPYLTDFGPETLAQFLRAEVAKLRPIVTPREGKGKGKDRLPRQRDGDHVPSPPTPVDFSDTSEENEWEELGESHAIDTRALSFNDGDFVNPYPDWAESFLSTEQSDRSPNNLRPEWLVDGNDDGVIDGAPIEGETRNSGDPSLSAGESSQLSVTDLYRRTHFEEHTKSKREAVRSMAATNTFETEPTLSRHLVEACLPRKVASHSEGASSPATLSAEPRASRTDGVGQSTLSSRTTDRLDPGKPGMLESERPSTGLVESIGWASKDYHVDCANDEVLPGPIPKTEISNLADGIVSDLILSRKNIADNTRRVTRQARGTSSSQRPIPQWNYGQLLPFTIPKAVRDEFLDLVRASKPRRTRNSAKVSHEQGEPSTQKPDSVRNKRNKWRTSLKACPRVFVPSEPHSVAHPGHGHTDYAIPPAGTESMNAGWVSLQDLIADNWVTIAQSLSSQDIRNLRLTSRTLARVLAGVQFRNVVVKFGRQFFEHAWSDPERAVDSSARESMLKRYGEGINQFGISFEYDSHGLAGVTPKVIEHQYDAWFGKFTWPTEHYPRFPPLQEVEDLVDHNHPFLKEAFQHVKKASELGLCIDSGHGWLAGPDISDMALFDRRVNRGSKVFGKTFETEDVWTTLARNEYFKWAQQNTIGEAMRELVERAPVVASAARDLLFLERCPVHDLEAFKTRREQRGGAPDLHVGGLGGLGGPAGDDTAAWDPRAAAATLTPQNSRSHAQWPLIFNGHNIAAELGGQCSFLQAKTAWPSSASLLPGSLTEAQAQWLMETAWAQRAFLSSYTTAVITNKANFRLIHTLRISKLSSGLLPSLEQREFWRSLPRLEKLHMFVSPDWRQEYVIGDRFYAQNMPVAPHKAAQRFTRFLRTYVSRIESLHSLHVGYVGGGEQAVGMFARNQHVLPAPVVVDPAEWLHASHTPARLEMTKFDHIRDLSFHNCWFSPWMLKEFMERSKDTSLHSLTLDSVSLVPLHSPNVESTRLTTATHNLRCAFPREDWAWEELPPQSAAWCQVIHWITPGPTLDERRRAAGFEGEGRAGDREEDDNGDKRSARQFRGHVHHITLRSCGYVKVSLPEHVRPTGFNQGAAVVHHLSPADKGLVARKERFRRGQQPPPQPQPPPNVLDFLSAAGEVGGNNNVNPRPPRHRATTTAAADDDSKRAGVMLSERAPTGEYYPWLGTLTQCVHPVEKRVLEEAWGMTFGWPADSLDRHAAVEDGFFEGGTGRFGGVLQKSAGPAEDI